MKELGSPQMEKQFGKYGFFSKPANSILIAKIEYLSGIPPFDYRLKGKPFNKKTNSIYLEMRPHGLEIRLTEGFTGYLIGFKFEQIKYFVFEAQQQVMEFKSKSIVGRAFLGGLLLGPVGAIVGGMTGIGDKAVKSDKYPDNILSICIVDDDNEEKHLFFSVENGNLKDAIEFVSKNFKDKLKTINDINSSEKSETTKKPIEISVADELLKLKQLLDDGVLTEDEFNQQKAKLLK